MIETDCFTGVFGDEVREYIDGMVMGSYPDQVVIKKVESSSSEEEDDELEEEEDEDIITMIMKAPILTPVL